MHALEKTDMEQDIIAEGETLDQLSCGGVKLIQARKGYRFSLDPVLLANFATLHSGEQVLDLGCGCGVMALILARRYADVEVVGVEIQARQAARAQRSVRLNGLEARVRIEHADVRTWSPEASGIFTRVLCNPPFRPPRSGRISAGTERSISRHELHGTLDDFIRCAAMALHRSGTLSMVHLPERLTDVVLSLRANGLEPKRLRMVHSRAMEPARLFLIEAQKGGRPGMNVEAPLYVYADDGTDGGKGGSTGGAAERAQRRYSDEVRSYYV
jgi:tRNA1Val (adenine37-N6)-methyltransferase